MAEGGSLRRPAVGLFASVAAGSLIGSHLGHGGLALAGAACMAAAARVARRRDAGRGGSAGCPSSTGWVLCAALLVAWTSAAWNPQRPFSPPAAAGRTTAVIGTVVSDAECRVRKGGGSTAVWSLTLRVESNRVGRAWVAPHGSELRVRWFGPAAAVGPAYGDRLELEGRLVPGGRSPVLVTGRRGTRWLSAADAPGGFSAHRLAYRLRAAASRRLRLGIESRARTVDVLDALLLGYRGTLGPELRDVFVRTGTLHLFAISGQHVCMLAGMAVMVLRMAKVSRRVWVLPLAPVLVLYTLATGAEPSAVRACVMAVIFFAAPLFGRRTDGLSVLAAAAVFIVLLWPADLARVGFVLSFAVTAGLIVWVPILFRAARLGRGVWRRRLGRNPEWDRLEAPKQGGGRLRRWARAAVAGTGVLVAFSAAAWVVSAPLTAYYFGRFSPVGLLSNLAVVPLAYLVVLCGCLSLAGALFGEFVSIAFNHANVALVALLLGATRGLAAVPGACVELAPPGAAAVWLWMGSLALAAAAADRWLTRADD